jgi:magnesium-dependent phosphatase 1
MTSPRQHRLTQMPMGQKQWKMPQFIFTCSLIAHLILCMQLCFVRCSFAWINNQVSYNFSKTRTTKTFGFHSKKTVLQSMSYPELSVFDLDACFWDQEMYQMSEIPTADDKVIGDLNGRGQGVVGVMSGGHKISLHKGSLVALQNHADCVYGTMKVAFASSADTPFAEKVGRASLKMLEVLPGLTVWDLVVGRDWQGRDVNQIGRQPPLTSNKSATHFPFLKRETGIRFDRMLFFDDCGWDDHCGMVSSRCREPDTNQGPATVRTPDGLRAQDWEKGLEIYAKQAESLSRRTA